jgi:Disulphide bond corrector protein DsbC
VRTSLAPWLRGYLRDGIAVLGVIALGIAVPGEAQAPSQTVQWTAAVDKSSLGGAKSVVLEVSGHVADGWHVYALEQAPGGPTPLRIALDANEFARLAGRPAGTVPERKFDPSFGLDTQFYSGSFAVRVPVRITPSTLAGTRSIPVSVRFQTCDGRECEPPRTIHLSVPIDATAERRR